MFFQFYAQLFVPQLSSISATSCPWVECLREPSSAVWRRSLETVASWPAHQETMPQLSPTTLRPRSPESSCPQAQRKSSPLPTELLLVRTDGVLHPLLSHVCLQVDGRCMFMIWLVIVLTSSLCCSRCGCWRWSYWQAHLEGWSGLPQIQGQEELLATCPWCGYECKSKQSWFFSDPIQNWHNSYF